MRKLIPFLIAFVLLATAGTPVAQLLLSPPPFLKGPSSVTATSQLLLNTSTYAATGTRYAPLGYSWTGSASSADFKAGAWPVSGTLTEMRIRDSANLGGGQTNTITLVKNGSDTALTCNWTTGASGCTGSTAVTVSPGDWTTWKIVNAGGTPAGPLSASFIFVPDTPNDTVIFSHGISFLNSAVRAVQPYTNAAIVTVSSARTNDFPDGGTIDKLYVLSNAPGAGTSYAYTADKNGSTTSAPTCTIADAATSCNDTSTSPLSVALLDDMQFQASPTNTPAAATAGFGLRYVPTTAGAFAYMTNGQVAANDNASAIRYSPLTGSVGWTATEAAAQNVTHSSNFHAMYVTTTAPGGAATRTFTLRKNATTDTAMACTITGAATSCCVNVGGTGGCVAGGPVSFADGDRAATTNLPSGTPTTGAPRISYLVTR